MLENKNLVGKRQTCRGDLYMQDPDSSTLQLPEEIIDLKSTLKKLKS